MRDLFFGSPNLLGGEVKGSLSRLTQSFRWGVWSDPGPLGGEVGRISFLFLGSPDLLGVGGGCRSPDGHRSEFKILHQRSLVTSYE